MDNPDASWQYVAKTYFYYLEYVAMETRPMDSIAAHRRKLLIAGVAGLGKGAAMTEADARLSTSDNRSHGSAIELPHGISQNSSTPLKKPSQDN